MYLAKHYLFIQNCCSYSCISNVIRISFFSSVLRYINNRISLIIYFTFHRFSCTILFTRIWRYINRSRTVIYFILNQSFMDRISCIISWSIKFIFQLTRTKRQPSFSDSFYQSCDGASLFFAKCPEKAFNWILSSFPSSGLILETKFFRYTLPVKIT